MALLCSFFLSNEHFLKTDFDFDTSGGKPNGKLLYGNGNHFDIAEVS